MYTQTAGPEQIIAFSKYALKYWTDIIINIRGLLAEVDLPIAPRILPCENAIQRVQDIYGCQEDILSMPLLP